eukprot:10064901-Alexandrium_andersonii.AAC.1
MCSSEHRRHRAKRSVSGAQRPSMRVPDFADSRPRAKTFHRMGLPGPQSHPCGVLASSSCLARG